MKDTKKKIFEWAKTNEIKKLPTGREILRQYYVDLFSKKIGRRKKLKNNLEGFGT